MNITFIGNCQLISLCFYFQQLLSNKDNYVCWVNYGDEILPHLGNWAEKCKNKIIDYDVSIETIKNSDIIIYQEISLSISSISNTNKLSKLKKNNCKLIKIPSIHLTYSDFDNSIQEIIKRENTNNVDIKVSDLFVKYRDRNLMITNNHPKTFLFLSILDNS